MLAELEHGLDFFAHVALSPAVHLERAIAHVVALLREVDVGLRRGEAPIAIAVERARVRRQTRTPAAEHFVDRLLHGFARPIPQRDVDETVTHMVELSQRALADVVEVFALARILADQHRRQGEHLRQGNLGAAPLR